MTDIDLAMNSSFSATQPFLSFNNESYGEKEIEKIESIEKALKNEQLDFDEEKKLKDLYLQYLSEEEYEYQKNQEELFYQSLPQLIKNHSGMYIWFENGNVLAFDPDEEILLDKIETSNYFQTKKSKAVYVRRIPEISRSA